MIEHFKRRPVRSCHVESRSDSSFQNTFLVVLGLLLQEEQLNVAKTPKRPNVRRPHILIRLTYFPFDFSSLRDTIKTNPPGFAELIEKHSSPSQLESIKKMFADNPNLFDEIKQNLAEISAKVAIPLAPITAQSRPQTPAPPTPTKRAKSTKAPPKENTNRRHSAPCSITQRRASVRIASIRQNKAVVHVDEVTAVNNVKSAKEAKEAKDRQEKKRNSTVTYSQGKLLDFENALEMYALAASRKDLLLKGLQRGNVCKACCSLDEKLNQDLVKCSGDCGDHIHRKCAKIDNPHAVTCNECAELSSPICYACKTDCLESFFPCSFRSCGRYYHAKCLNDWPQTKQLESGKVICPSHVCHICVSDDPRNKHVQDGKLTHCIRCPTTYHIDSTCIPAGVEILTTSQHICLRHRTETRKPPSVNWCYLCGKKGKHFEFHSIHFPVSRMLLYEVDTLILDGF